MDYFFKKLFSGSATAALAASLFFTTPVFEIQDSNILISGKLKGIFTEKMVRILQTSTPVTLTYHVSLIVRQGEDVKVLKQRVTQSITYNSLNSEYTITRRKKKWKLKDKIKAYKKFGSYQLRFSQPYNSGKFKGNFYIEAHISYVSKLNLKFSGAALWDHYIPSKRMNDIELEISE